MPPSKQLWVIFAIIVSIGTILTVLLFQNTTELAGKALFVLLAIPLWLAGFSLPVLAWWGTSTPFIGLPTRRREAESWLIAGMASAFPAFVFNSLVAPELIPSSFPLWATELTLLALGAPLCEELFKGGAVALFLPSIKGPRHGFQVGFTVGLGFALIENFQYIGSSLLGGPLAATLTILVRGIGSIPGHAVWTAMTGTAIGWMATDKAFKARMTWRAKSLAISAIDLAEGLGLDTDGDGDLSGFDGERPTLEEAVEDAMAEQTGQDGAWLLMDPSQSSLPGPGGPASYPVEIGDYGVSYSDPPDSSDLPISFSPKSLGSALGLAMVGHSLWNGTSYLSGFVPSKMGFGEVGTSLVVLGWTIFLIATILVVARRLLRGIRTLDTPF
jgi:RsiW-degrading membrane proteinase PrsW (M82 family)